MKITRPSLQQILKKSWSTKKRRSITTAVALLLTACLLTIGLQGYRYAVRPLVLKNGFLNIPTGASFSQEVKLLVSKGFIADSATIKRYAARFGNDQARAGRYKIDSAMTCRQLLSRLSKGSQSPVRVTFNNIRTLDQLAGRIARYIEPDSATLLSAFKNDSTTQALGFDRATFISLFIPNTYEFYWNTTPEAFIQKMKTEYDRFWSKREEQLKATGMTKNQVVTLASIVIEETKYKPEMPTVASVYLNRLRIGMPLQADPTVKFAIGDFSIKRVMHSHLQTPSPYNTYQNAGLPPGPICIPDIAAVDAVLNAAPTSYFYFCAAPDLSGKHRFASTLDEHGVNARAYARALNKRGIR